VSGRPRAITDRNKAYDLLATLISKNEQRIGSTGYDFAAQPREYVDRMMQGIRPFEMEIEAIEESSSSDRNVPPATAPES
jgi:predicted FMN-binding regulatory protein PaiB